MINIPINQEYTISQENTVDECKNIFRISRRMYLLHNLHVWIRNDSFANTVIVFSKSMNYKGYQICGAGWYTYYLVLISLI